MVNIAERRLERANGRAADAASDVTVFDGVVRFNPAACECPPYELAVGPRWVRIDAQPSREPSQTALDWLGAPAGLLQTRIELTRDESRADNGWGYRTVLIGSVPDADNAE
ncbi:MAG: hypothetical protein ACJAYU_000742 [Bradymonadia bacterium]